jgi:isopentenyl diphosphate isomerase/L-lactate dehydrogenase-like FMN-dependent dehydrogenase
MNLMGLTDIYQKGKKILGEKEFGWVLDAVETGFIFEHDRRILDRYTFRPHYIDGVVPKTTCRILDVELATPVIMSAMTMPIPAITDNGMMDVAQGLKDAGSLMWTGTPIPKDLKEEDNDADS